MLRTHFVIFSKQTEWFNIRPVLINREADENSPRDYVTVVYQQILDHASVMSVSILHSTLRRPQKTGNKWLIEKTGVRDSCGSFSSGPLFSSTSNRTNYLCRLGR